MTVQTGGGGGEPSDQRLPPWAKPVALSASLAVGRVTGRFRILPAFLIVGAQRCGTTSMYRTLAQHPATLKPVWHKGMHYFDTGYARGISWYRAHFALARTARRVQRSIGTEALAFESSPYYMFHPLAGQRIAADLPAVKLLVLLRDPVERAYSAHAHEIARGYETEPFEAALDLETSRLQGQVERMIDDPRFDSHTHQHNAYVTRGQYIDQLERLERLVGRKRIHVVDSQDFFETPASTYRGVLAFLGLPETQSPVFEQHNARPRSRLPEAVRARLKAHYEPYDERLARWLGTTPSWRR